MVNPHHFLPWSALIYAVCQGLQLSKSCPLSLWLQLDELILSFISGFFPHLRFPHCSFCPFFSILPLSSIILFRLQQFPLSFISHLQRTWVKSVSFPQSPQHTHCPANILSLANYASFQAGREECPVLLAC